MNERLRQRAETLLASVEKQSPGLLQLAEVLSLAVRVEPALLRKARLTLAPRLGVGAEADLWFGPLVESSGAGGFVFRREVAELLRERLAGDPARLEAAWKLTRSFHSFIPPAAALEEEVTWAALAGHSEDELDRKLGRALTAMLSNPRRGVGIARWALRALPRLPERARRSESAALLTLGTLSRVDGTWLRLNDVLPERLPQQAVRVLADVPKVAVRLVRGPEGITFLGPDAAEGQRLELPDTRPPLLELTWEENGEQRRELVSAEPGMHVALSGNVERLQLRAPDGHRWELTTVLAQEQQVPSAPSEKRAGVFISAAWPATLQLRGNLARLLPEIAFTAPTLGESFSDALGQALLKANLVVIFANAAYWRSELSRRELRLVLLPYTRLPSDSPPEAQRAALEHLVIVRPERGFDREAFELLPRELLETQWPRLGDDNALATLLRQRLEAPLPRLRQRLEAVGLSDTTIQEILWKQPGLPLPSDLTSVRHFPSRLPPSAGDGFVGRDNALWQLDAFLSARSPSTVVLVEGFAGVGKTRLALEYVHRFGPQSFPGGIFWVDAAADEQQLQAQLHGILRILRPDTPGPGSFRGNTTRALALALEEEGQKAPILYVVDGFPQPLPGRSVELLFTYCPGFEFVSVLVTASESILEYSMPGRVITRQRLDLLDSGAAVALLTHGLQDTRLTPQDWQAIAERVGHLPLALELINKLLWLGRLGSGEVLMRLKTNAVSFLDEQMRTFAPDLPLGARGLTEVLADTYEGLPEPARQLAKLVAHCAPAPVPVALLEAMGRDAKALAATDTLVELGFLARENVLEIPTLRMRHRLLGEFITQSSDLVSELMWVCRGLLAIMEPDSLRNPARWPLLRACLPHAEEVFEILRHIPLEAETARFVELGIRVSRFRLAEGHPARARPFASEAYEQATKVLGPKDRKAIDALACLAAVERSEGHLSDAQSHYEERRTLLAESLQSAEHPDFFVATMELGETLLARGDLTSARKELQSALYMANRYIRGTHPQTAIVKSLLGEVLRHDGDAVEARRLQQEALEALRQTHGRDHLDTLTAENHLAATLTTLRAMTTAQRLQEEVLERSRTLLGEDHPLTLGAMNNLAEILEVQGQQARAGELREMVARLLLLREELETDTSGVEEEPEESTSFPPPPSDVELQDLISDQVFSETPAELAEMGNVRVESVNVYGPTKEEMLEGRRIIRGDGTISVELMVGDDGLDESFPFDFTVEQHADGSLHITQIKPDTSWFYGEHEDPDGVAGPEDEPVEEDDEETDE